MSTTDKGRVSDTHLKRHLNELLNIQKELLKDL